MNGTARRTRDNALDCVRCGLWFPWFDVLADHMHRAHRTPRSAPVADARQQATQQKEQRPMASIPKPRTADREGGAAAFLKAAHLGKKKRARLLLIGEARTQKGTFGEQLIVGVKLGKTRYDWAFNLNSGNHTRLYKRFGANPKKWKGPIDVELKEFNGNMYLAVTD